MTTPHTPKTLAKYVAELRQKVHDDDDDDDDEDDNVDKGDNWEPYLESEQ